MFSKILSLTSALFRLAVWTPFSHPMHAWFEHELLLHRSQRVCSECSLSFRSSDDLKGHVSRQQDGLVSDRQLPAFMDQSRRLVDSRQPSGCPFCDDSWAQVDPSLASSEKVLVVNLDHFRGHLGKHLIQVAPFSLPRLTQDPDKSLGPCEDGGVLDRDSISKGSRWIRDDCGSGWSVILRKRRTLIALASFLTLYRVKRRKVKRSELQWASTLGEEKKIQLKAQTAMSKERISGGIMQRPRKDSAKTARQRSQCHSQR